MHLNEYNSDMTNSEHAPVQTRQLGARSESVT